MILRVTLVACAQRTSRGSFAFACVAAHRPRQFNVWIVEKTKQILGLRTSSALRSGHGRSPRRSMGGAPDRGNIITVTRIAISTTAPVNLTVSALKITSQVQCTRLSQHTPQRTTMCAWHSKGYCSTVPTHLQPPAIVFFRSFSFFTVRSLYFFAGCGYPTQDCSSSQLRCVVGAHAARLGRHVYGDQCPRRHRPPRRSR